MIDYRDFMQKAEFDLERAEIMYKKGDYGFAAYSVQQGMEKYLKSYLLKFNLVKDIHKLGHLQYSEIAGIIIEIFEDQKKKETDSDMIKVLDATINNFKTLHRIFSKIQKSHDQKILFWKRSLGIKLNKNEENILDGIRTESNTSANKYLSTLSNYLVSESFAKNLQKKKLPVKLKEKIPKFLIEYSNASRNGDTNKARQIMNSFMATASPYFYGSGPNSLSKGDTDFMIKMTKMETTFDWSEYTLLLYPHQDIGRYPTLIDDKNSEELYEENKENLWQLIQEIRIICSRIKQNLSSNF